MRRLLVNQQIPMVILLDAVVGSMVGIVHSQGSDHGVDDRGPIVGIDSRHVFVVR